jgi:hypothetical protein
MGDAQRPLALAELARTGVSPSGENRLTPFVRDFLLARRRRFALAADGRRRAADGRQIDPLRIARCDVTRVDSAHGPGDDLLLTGDDRVTLLDGRDGSIAFQTEVPGCGSHPRHGMVVGRDGTRRAWVEGGNGAIALVDWRGGRSDSVAALGGGRAIAPEPTTWCASAPDLRGDPWFVQAYEVVDSVAGGLRPCTRVVRVRADGVHERVLTGSPLVAPARANDEGLFLPLEQRIEAALPVGRRTGRMREDLWHLCALDVGADLATRGTTWVSEVRVALALPSSVRARQLFGDGELRFFWIVGAGETCLDAPSGSGPWLFPTELAATYFLRDGSGRLFVWSCGKEGAPLLQPLPPPPQGDWRVVPAEDDWVEPLLLSGDGGELREVAPAAVTLRARDLAWSGDLVFGALVRAPGRPLIVRTRAGDWFGVALDEPSRRFKRNLARATIGEQVTQLPGGAIAISAQATPFEAWVRDGERFELLDDAGVVRPPIEQFVVADLGGTGRFDPVLRFSDGSLVALRPPDPRMARLAEEWSLAVRGAATAADR